MECTFNFVLYLKLHSKLQSGIKNEINFDGNENICLNTEVGSPTILALRTSNRLRLHVYREKCKNEESTKSWVVLKHI